MNTYSSIPGDRSTQRSYSIAKFPSWWPSVPTFLSHRVRRRLRSARSKIRARQSPTSNIASLSTSFNPADTIRDLRSHNWTAYDAQYLFLAVLGIFSLSVIQTPGPLIKTMVAGLLMTSLIIPITRQFFLPFLPIASWLIFFYACQFVPAIYRPGIWVRVLPALENILYGANLSNILSAHKNTVLNVLAWIPYGLTHFGAPFVCSLAMFICAPPGTVPVFARSFGYMNITGVLIQMFFPCSPPWYENMYGLAPANYSMPGSPAGLAAIDKILGFDLYTSTFTASPLVFGAFPSLHSGSATIEALFMCHTFPRLRPLFIAYALWLWWSTMYLSHHYAIDLVAGSLIAAVVYFIAEAKFLPRLQPGKNLRWAYDYVEYGEAAEKEEVFDLTDFESLIPHSHSESDDWTIGSSSGRSSSSSDPKAGMRSPSSDSWDDETLAGLSDHEDLYRKV
ncbi:hypothetical protein BAUCODRAFT_499183 [Baudoinia panamericana UAMH 10762]|uniref:Phosphatidic acid phosphatase type 2/haloperoxidase domain-containing protein n=1 Tax=Baudoinia panamericana (strain UAMH 10762) TaxID=717646 RepID=M2NA11_BAUPA|nr:uncharacterized protein BAUCODRAFT_499183 [Baudoinia panamericana UAMH 10762]EMC95690.1 hypothetical protein BAUCODRAFT_499183 [Baudoinia panamericana UAMH 10762]